MRCPAFACLAAAVLISALSIRPAAATLIIVPNASFEAPDVVDEEFTITFAPPVIANGRSAWSGSSSSSPGFPVTATSEAIPGWDFAQTFNGTITAGVWDPGEIDFTGAGGNNATLPATAQGGQSGYIYLEQLDDLLPEIMTGELTTEAPLATITSDTIYTLTVAIGSAKTFLPGDVTISLYSDATALATTVIPAASIPNDSFADFTATFTSLTNEPLAGNPIVARITHTHTTAGARSVEFDNVRLDASPVPEPAGIAAAALLALGALARRSRR
jgi:MYXO-CTERM domain-containing protein